MMRRRPSLVAIAAAWLGWPLAARARAPGLRPLSAPETVAQIAAGGPSGLLAVGASGALYALQTNGAPAARLADGVDPAAPLAAAQDRIAWRRQDGALCVRDAEGLSASPAGALAPEAGLLVTAPSIFGVTAQDPAHRLVRMSRAGAGVWAPATRSDFDVLPDAHPLLADLDGRGDGGHVVVLASPDGDRYRHGVLGDAIEATRLCWLDRQDLRVRRELTLPDPHVFEDIAPRPVPLAGREGLLTVRSGPQGAQLVLVDADPVMASSLRLLARGAPLGQAHRWMAPTVHGPHWLAVHTPHIGGVLHAYRQDGDRLSATRITDGVANHVIGSRRLDLAAWTGRWLALPDQRRRQLLLLDSSAGWPVAQAWPLHARLVASASLGAAAGPVLGVAVLHEDGSVALAPAPA